MAAGFVAFFVIWIGFLVLGLGSFVVLIMSVVDIAGRPDWQWFAAGQSRITWLLVSILVPFCSFVYWFSIRRKLIAVATMGGPPGYPLPLLAAPMVPANWYPDPHVANQRRYWNGNSWTDHVQAAAAAGPTPA